MDEQPLEVQIGILFNNRGLRLAVAESCTGGLISQRITNVPGSSDYYVGGITAYANEAKMRLLGVRQDTLEKHGAVSRETVLEMARGVCQAISADCGIAVSGIAGPGGGTPEKPVGLVWIALVAGEHQEARRFLWGGDRLAVKEQSAEAALRMLVDYLGGESNDRASERSNQNAPGEFDPLILVEATARFDIQGGAFPQSFSWEGITYRISSTGRRWETTNGLHVLVMEAGGKVFEMIFTPSSCRWYVKRPVESHPIA
jgi:PncC family amidohydrolase